MTYDLEPALPQTQTPKDYARIHFDPVEVPATRIVGLLACQREYGERSERGAKRLAEGKLARCPSSHWQPE